MVPDWQQSKDNWRSVILANPKISSETQRFPLGPRGCSGMKSDFTASLLVYISQKKTSRANLLTRLIAHLLRFIQSLQLIRDPWGCFRRAVYVAISEGILGDVITVIRDAPVSHCVDDNVNELSRSSRCEFI